MVVACPIWAKGHRTQRSRPHATPQSTRSRSTQRLAGNIQRARQWYSLPTPVHLVGFGMCAGDIRCMFRKHPACGCSSLGGPRGTPPCQLRPRKSEAKPCCTQRLSLPLKGHSLCVGAHLLCGRPRYHCEAVTVQRKVREQQPIIPDVDATKPEHMSTPPDHPRAKRRHATLAPAHNSPTLRHKFWHVPEESGQLASWATACPQLRWLHPRCSPCGPKPNRRQIVANPSLARRSQAPSGAIFSSCACNAGGIPSTFRRSKSVAPATCSASFNSSTTLTAAITQMEVRAAANVR